jgi:hypothetical protein
MLHSHAPFHQRSPSADSDGDIRMASPPGSRASSVSGGGDAGPGLALRPPRLITKRHPVLNGIVPARQITP